MADQNLKDFSVNWILFGLLFICLISFALSFAFNNNPNAFGDAGGVFNDTMDELSVSLTQLPSETNSLMNVTAKTNPEESFLGSRDSVAVSYSITGEAKKYWDATKLFVSWIFSGAIGKLLIAVFGGIFTILSVYFITKWFRTGA